MLRARLAAALLVPLTLIAGCTHAASEPSTARSAASGGSVATSTTLPAAFQGMTAGQIWSQAQSDVDSARAVHVVARLLDSKDKVAIDLAVTKDDKAIGNLTLGGNQLAIRRTGKVVYFKADSGFWHEFGDDASAKKFTDKWIKVTQGHAAMASLFEFTEMNFFTDQALTLSAAQKRGLVVVAGTSVAGASTIGLADAPDNRKNADTGTLYVTSKAPTLPMSFTVGTNGVQYISFEDWDKAVQVDVPAGAFDLDPFLP